MDIQNKIAIVGGGPVGLFLSIKLSMRGYHVDLFEKGSWPIDKVCGQGLMPTGVNELKEIGLDFEIHNDYYPIKSIEYFDEHKNIKGNLPSIGMGVFRNVLSSKLYAKAKSISAIKLHENTFVHNIGHVNSHSRVFLELGVDKKLRKEFDYIFCCDGMNSRTRKLMNLNKSNFIQDRMGARLHYDISPWSESVEVYWGSGVEAYVTPISNCRVEIAFLWFGDRLSKGPFLEERLLDLFPILKEKVANLSSIGDFRGYGPFSYSSKKINDQNIFFVGDSYCFLDGITGEGLSLGFKSATIISNSFENFRFVNKLKIKYLYFHYSFFVFLALFLSKMTFLRSIMFSIIKKYPVLFHKILKVSNNL
jgi:2-polyprenyl-6-methoxyphenol hydroxylase-like FAD-dependent oxidoreductase